MSPGPRLAPPLCLLLAGCASAGAWQGEPWSPPSTELAAIIARAEVLLEEDRVADALEAAREAVELRPGSADARRILQSARVVAGEDAAVRREAEEAVAASPGDPLALYLLARTETDGRRAERLLRDAADADPGMPWPRLALAQGLIARGDFRAARHELERAEADQPGHAWVPLLAAQSATSRNKPAEAVECLREVVRRDPDGFRGQEGLARHLSRIPGGDAEAREVLARAFGAAPGSRSIATAWRESLDRGATPEEARRAVDAVDRMGAGGPPSSPALHLRGAALLLLGEAERALPDLRAALRGGEDRTAILDALRLALFRLGRYGEALAEEREATPADLPGDPSPRLLMEAVAAHLAAHPGDREALARLTDLCRRLGWHREAAHVALLRREADPSDGAARADAEETAATLRFLEELRHAWRGTYHGYDAGKSGDDLEGALAGLREISLRILGVDLTDGLSRRSYALLGEMAESVRASGPARAWFDAHGLALLVGRAAGESVEARLLRVVSLRRDAEWDSLGRKFRATVVVGEGLVVPSRREAGGAVLGGATVDDLVFLDLEGVARWSGAALRARKDPAVRKVLEGVDRAASPGPGDTDPLRFPGRLADRIALAVDAWDDPRAALGDFLDAALRHELGHAADASRHLPILSHPFAGLQLYLRGRLTAAGTASVLEGDAEIASVASAREPRAALATLVSFLPARDAGAPHGRGYYDALRELLGVLRERGAVAEGVPGLRGLDRLDPEVLRSAAREVCRRRGLLGP